jgi:hypothetical protein
MPLRDSQSSPSGCRTATILSPGLSVRDRHTHHSQPKSHPQDDGNVSQPEELGANREQSSLTPVTKFQKNT